MRQLTELADEALANRFSDTLTAEGIANAVRTSGPTVTVWVEDERRMNEARAILQRFVADPDDPQFEQAAKKAAQLRKARDQKTRAAEKRVVLMSKRFAASRAIGPVTMVLMLACLAVAYLTTSMKALGEFELGDKTDMVTYFTIQGYVREGDMIRWLAGFTDIGSGQIWRLVTPMLLHFGILHILFNLWWLKDLGTIIERRSSSLVLLVMVLVISTASNVGQYLVTSNPAFGGMSGVVYGLFGYLWIRSRLDPRSGIVMPKQTVWWMLGFYVVCWTGLIGPIANWVHTFGLMVGGLWGLVTGGPRNWRRLFSR